MEGLKFPVFDDSFRAKFVFTCDQRLALSLWQEEDPHKTWSRTYNNSMKNVEKFFQYSNSTIIYVYISFSFLTFSYYDIEIIPCLQLVNVSHSPAEKKKIHTNKKNTSANDRYTIDNISLKTLLPYSDLLSSPSIPRASPRERQGNPERPALADHRRRDGDGELQVRGHFGREVGPLRRWHSHQDRWGGGLGAAAHAHG